MIDHVSQKNDFRNLTSCPFLLSLTSGKSKNDQQYIGYERRPPRRRRTLFDWFLPLSCFSFIAKRLIYRISFSITINQAWHALVRAAFKRSCSLSLSLFLKDLITTKVYTSFSDLQHCPKNTAILSQILFGFCRLHDYFTFFSLLYIYSKIII